MQQITFPDFDEKVMVSINGRVIEAVDDLMRRLPKELDSLERAAWRVGCCERVFPNYAIFSRTHRTGNEMLLRKLIDQAWTSVLATGNLLPEQTVDDILPQLDFDCDYENDLLQGSAENTLSVLDIVLCNRKAEDRDPLKAAAPSICPPHVSDFRHTDFSSRLTAR